LQYSAEISAFSDFPPKIKDVMSQKEVVEYLLDYAKAHNLQRMAKLNTEVVDVRRHAEYESNGKWLIKYRSCDSKNELKEDEFDCVLICAGMKQKPWRPNDYRAERSFRGRISHASEFESVENYRNKTVVLVGFGNSAANIARTLGSVAKKV
jgi:dimethylaniline monooxygenase (N-oxide forming)